MVSVPITSNRRLRNVDPEVQSQFRGATPRDFVGPAIQRAGAALGQAAADFDAVEAMYDEADATRIANEYRDLERERLRTGENAYLATQGFNAGEGREAVVGDLQSGAEGLLGGARSERARAMAKRVLDQRLGNSQSTIAAHALQQMTAAREEQAGARISGAITDAIDARGTEQFAINLALAQQELGDQAVRLGWSEEQLDQENAKLVSNAFARTALAMDAEDGAPTRALEFVEANADRINPDDEARLIAQLSPRVDQAWASDVINSGALEQYLPDASVPAVTGTNDADLDAITAQTESNNRNFNADGSVVTSPVGARFAMQVMPATARDPGFGLKPADPNNAEDMNRLGREYRAVMEERYGGDLAKMWAAYNAGPGRVDAAVARHGADWLRHMPLETRDYVAKNMKAAGQDNVAASGVASDPRLNSQAMRGAVDAYIAANPNISERRKQALYAEADRVVSRSRSDRAQAEGEADRRLQDWLTENMPDPDDLTSMSQIPSAILSGTSPGARSSINSRIQQAQSRIQAASDAAAAANAKRLEEEAVFELYTLTDEELATVDMRKYSGRIDLQTLGPWIDRQQRAAQSGSGKPVDSDKIARKIDTLGKDFGASRALDASDDERQAWIALRGYVEQRVAGRADKDVSSEELRSIILGGMQEVQVEGTGWFGTNWGNDTVQRAQLPAGAEVDLDDLPEEAIADIRANLQRNGIKQPSDALIWTTYQEGRAQGIF